MGFPAGTPQIAVLTASPPDALSSRATRIAPPAPGARSAVDELLWRIQRGDRSAAAEFLLRYGSRIRRRIRGKLGPDVRRLFDSLDILSTLGRRLDLYVMSGRLDVASEDQLLALLCKMADHALIEKARLYRHLQNTEGEDGEFARSLAARLQESERTQRDIALEIESCMRTLEDPLDRQILSLWITGERHAAIGRLVDLPATAVRSRWQSIKSRLRERFKAAIA